MRKNVKGLIGTLILSAAILNGCGSGSSVSTGACGNPKTCYLSSVAYGAGEFVAVGSGGEADANGEGQPWIETSTDGINWKHEDITYTGVQTYPKPILQSITYGKDGFVTTDGVHVLHSTDGLNWNVDSFESASDKISYVIYDGTRYILYSNTTGSGGRPSSDGLAFVTDNFPWKVSTDGVNWTDYGTITVTNGPAGEPVSIIHVAGMYEAAWQPAMNRTTSTPFYIATSSDGLSWTLGTPVAMSASLGIPTMYCILHTGDQFLVWGGTDESATGIGSWGVVLYGSSLSAMTAAGPLYVASQYDPAGEFYPAGEPIHGDSYETTGLVSNGAVTLGLGEGGLFMTTDGVTWNHESMDGVVPETGCAFAYPGTPTCTAFAAGAAAPGGAIVVLTTSGSAGAETTDGVHWVTSNL